MNKVIEELTRTCNYIAEDSTFHFAALYKEVLVKLSYVDIDDDLKQETLIQLYRFGYYSRVRKELDPVLDTHNKENILKLLLSEISKSNVYELNKFNDSLRRALDNPLPYIDAKYPGTIK